MQPERRRTSDGAYPLPPVRYRPDVGAGGSEPQAAEIFLERSVDLSGLHFLALRLFYVQLGLLGDLSLFSCVRVRVGVCACVRVCARLCACWCPLIITRPSFCSFLFGTSASCSCCSTAKVFDPSRVLPPQDGRIQRNEGALRVLLLIQEGLENLVCTRPAI